jgi:FMN reductase
MSKFSVVGISGSLNNASRTSNVVNAILGKFSQDPRFKTQLIELANAAPLLFNAPTRDRLYGNEAASGIVKTVEDADIIVAGTPVYRASYTGAFKHLFDLIHHETLIGKPVVLAATGGSLLHGLITEHQLRPLFAFFNALTIPTAIYATEADFSDYRISNPDIERRIERAVRETVDVFSSKKSAVVDAFSASHGALTL